MKNVVVKGTASNIYDKKFSIAGKTGTAKKHIPTYKNEKGETIYAHYSTKKYVASFVGFFPVEKPKYSCIVVIHSPKKEKGYYGATVAAPVFKEIAEKIFTSTPMHQEFIKEETLFPTIDNQYKKYYVHNKNHNVIPNVKGMPAMDAVALLENIG